MTSYKYKVNTYQSLFINLLMRNPSKIQLVQMVQVITSSKENSTIQIQAMRNAEMNLQIDA